MNEVRKQVLASTRKDELENERDGKEEWAKPQIQELEVRQGTLGSPGSGTDLAMLAS